MNYIVDHIPRTTPYQRRVGVKLEPDTLTIHNTANSKSTARNERGWLTNPSNVARASFHIVVDEREAIECIPLNEVALHAGTSGGNRTSLSIEICESGNYPVTLENAIELVAKMLYERKWGVDRLRRHFDWSGKNCPRLMNEDGKWSGWVKFRNRVAARLSEMEVSSLKREDALAVIQSLQNLWGRETDKAKKEEIHRQANAVRKAAGIPIA